MRRGDAEIFESGKQEKPSAAGVSHALSGRNKHRGTEDTEKHRGLEEMIPGFSVFLSVLRASVFMNEKCRRRSGLPA